MENTKTLVLTFKNEDKKHSLTLSYPKEGLDRGTVINAMQKISNADVFSYKDGALGTPSEAFYVERKVTPIE